VANIGKPSAWRKVSIHAPGRGSQSAAAGHQQASKKGSAKPKPKLQKITNPCQAGKVNAKPTDAPMNGAVQGAATTTANTPDNSASARG
jgi:hypothetical protein